MEILDTPERPSQNTYLKKSARLYKIYGGLIFLTIAISFVVRPVMDNQAEEMVDALVGLPILAMFVLAPLGLFYSWMSYKRKEGSGSARLKYTIGHLFFALLILLSLGIFIMDISDLLN